MSTKKAEDETDDQTRQLFPSVPEDKRLGILRTFHHKMYEDDTSGNDGPGLCSVFYDFYFNKNKHYCFVVFVAFALVLVGVLTMLYGFALPTVYRSLEGNQAKNSTVLTLDLQEAEKEKDIFLIASIGMISFGLIAAAFGLFMPLYQDAGQSEYEDSIVKTPILVDYELAPYKDSLKAGNNFGFVGDESSDWTPSPCDSPLDNVSFQSFFVQKHVNTPNE
uniref:Uncharacterized protein n=1 Tax=Clytia hemisphaerica TaxID=252671 RepID=A0A7M5V2S0_9CNID